MAQWTLTDNSTGTPVVLTFDWNPNKFTPPGRTANIKDDLTTAPNGAVILFQGRDRVTKGSFAGAVGTETFYNNLDTWKDKHYPLVLTDDQGSTWDILIVGWKWERVKRRNAWRYDYTCEFLNIP